MRTFSKRALAGLLPAILLSVLCACGPAKDSPSAEIPSSAATDTTTAASDDAPENGGDTEERASDDYLFEVNDDGTVTITKYLGKGGDVVIPAELDGMKVTAIGNTFKETGAFQGCASVTSAIIPDGVTEIQDNAFYSCTGLLTVTIPASVTLIRNCAFADCLELQSVYFEGDAPQIANYVFDARSLTFYYREGADGWTNPYYNCPTEIYD